MKTSTTLLLIIGGTLAVSATATLVEYRSVERCGTQHTATRIAPRPNRFVKVEAMVPLFAPTEESGE